MYDFLQVNCCWFLVKVFYVPFSFERTYKLYFKNIKQKVKVNWQKLMEDPLTFGQMDLNYLPLKINDIKKDWYHFIYFPMWDKRPNPHI
jgi:hypothetical protein